MYRESGPLDFCAAQVYIPSLSFTIAGRQGRSKTRQSVSPPKDPLLFGPLTTILFYRPEWTYLYLFLAQSDTHQPQFVVSVLAAEFVKHRPEQFMAQGIEGGPDSFLTLRIGQQVVERYGLAILH